MGKASSFYPVMAWVFLFSFSSPAFRKLKFTLISGLACMCNIQHFLAAESSCNDGATLPFLFFALYLMMELPSIRNASRNWFLILCECPFLFFLIAFTKNNNFMISSRPGDSRNHSRLLPLFLLPPLDEILPTSWLDQSAVLHGSIPVPGLLNHRSNHPHWFWWSPSCICLWHCFHMGWLLQFSLLISILKSELFLHQIF